MARPLPTVRNGGKTIAHHPHLHQTFRSHKATAYGQPRRVDGGVATTLWQGPAKGLINGFKWQGDEVAALRSRSRTVQRYDGAAKSTTPKPTPDDYLGTRCPHRTHCPKPCEVKSRPAYRSSCRRCSMPPSRCGRRTGMCVGLTTRAYTSGLVRYSPTLMPQPTVWPRCRGSSVANRLQR